DATAENADGDNFYISPAASDMAGVVTSLGQAVCPATIPPPPPSNRATVVVITNVVNDNGGVSSAGDFTMNVSALNPSQSSFAGVASPGVAVTVDAGSYSVD